MHRRAEGGSSNLKTVTHWPCNDRQYERVVIIIGDFESGFERLTGFPPFEWQKRLYRDYFAKGQVPSALDIPTGLGKTSVMAIWYLALKARAAVPRRLVYVVDRRSVVDQATAEADKIREKSNDCALRLSTLRGQHVDNREWLADPAAPAIVVGTVDMIGSRLLFSGYGVSRKMRPYHAGLLGTDALVVLDEAHLVPPFEKLLEAIANGAEAFGQQKQKDREIVPALKLLSLSATGREDGAGQENVFRLSPEHRKDETVRKRLEARKRLTIQVNDDAPKLVSELAERAWSLGDGPTRVLVYCDRRADAVKVKARIDRKFKKEKREHVSELLVGGRRVFEREALSDWLKEHGFFGDAEGPPERPTFLIATSAGEVGVDLDADHMVCDLVAWERMVQRLGRVNRRGKGDACIEVVAAPPGKKDSEKWEERLMRLRKPLDRLFPADVENVEQGGQLCLSIAECDESPNVDRKEKSSQASDCEGPHDASPGAILDLRARAEQDQDLHNAIEAATTSAPLRPALTRALVDAWSLTSLDEHTGRPEDIQPWLRGWEEDQQPQTTVVWRKHLPVRRDGTVARKKDIEAFFEASPPHASEKLETETYRVVEWLMERAKNAINCEFRDGVGNQDLTLRREDVVAYVLSPSMDLRDTVHGDSLIKGDKKEEKKAKENLKKNLMGGTLVMDRRFCGLSKDGMLDETRDPPRVIDDGEEWLTLQDGQPAIRFRVRSVAAGENPEFDRNWRDRHRFEVEKTDDGDVTHWLLVEKWRSDSETDDDRSAGPPQELAEHEAWTECKARTLTSALELPDSYADMLVVAAGLHDEGKRHERWQRAFNAPRDGKIYAKTKGPINVKRLEHYRHEFGSLPCAERDGKFKALPPDLQELALHLVATHHGWSRPVIPTCGSDGPPSVLEERALDVALRFARLQKRWGPWGLAWWEALLRAADQQASRDNDAGEGA